MDSLKQELKKLGNKHICPAIFFIRGENTLTGLRHYTSEVWRDISVWTVPAGRCEKGETIETTLTREIKEEIGITQFVITHMLGTVPGAKEGDVVPVFLGGTEQEPVQGLEPQKFGEWKWCPIHEIPDNFINPSALELVKKHLKMN